MDNNSLPDVVQEQSAASISEQALTKIVTPLTSVASEDARAEIGGVSEEMRGYIEQGLFAPTAEMAQITNKFEGRVVAYIHENEDGKWTVNFIQSYEDGAYSPEFMVDQSDLLTIAMGNQSQDPEMVKDCRIFAGGVSSTSKDKNGKAVFEWCDRLLDMEYFSQRIAKGEGNVAGGRGNMK